MKPFEMLPPGYLPSAEPKRAGEVKPFEMRPSVSVPGGEVRRAGMLKSFEMRPLPHHYPADLHRLTDISSSLLGLTAIQPCCAGCADKGGYPCEGENIRASQLRPSLPINPDDISFLIGGGPRPAAVRDIVPKSQLRMLCENVSPMLRALRAQLGTARANFRQAHASVQECSNPRAVISIECTELVRAQGRISGELVTVSGQCQSEQGRGVYNGPGCTRQNELNTEWMNLETLIRNCRNSRFTSFHIFDIDRECELRRMALERATGEIRDALQMINDVITAYDIEERRIGSVFAAFLGVQRSSSLGIYLVK